MLKPIFEDLNTKIKSRTKEQWVLYLKSWISRGRDYIQANGEVGFVAAFILGIFVVLFFRLAFALFFIAALVAGMVWCLAESELEQRSTRDTSDQGKIKQADDIDTTIQ